MAGNGHVVRTVAILEIHRLERAVALRILFGRHDGAGLAYYVEPERERMSVPVRWILLREECNANSKLLESCDATQTRIAPFMSIDH